MTRCSPLGAEFPGRRCLCGLMGVEQLAVGGKQWSRGPAPPFSQHWGSCLGVLPALAARGALYSKDGERAVPHSQAASLGDAKSQPKLFTTVFLSHGFYHLSQVLPLCGLLNKSLMSSPFSWRGCWDCAASLCTSLGLTSAPRLFSYSDLRAFSNTIPACPSTHAVPR